MNAKITKLNSTRNLLVYSIGFYIKESNHDNVEKVAFAVPWTAIQFHALGDATEAYTDHAHMETATEDK